MLNHNLIVLLMLIVCFSACRKEEPIIVKPKEPIRIAADVQRLVYDNKKEIILDASETLLVNGNRGTMFFKWTAREYPQGVQLLIEYPDSALTLVRNFALGKYRFDLTVTDKYGNRADSSYTFEVVGDTLIGKLPVANAGKDQEINITQNKFVLDGTESISQNAADRDLFYKWKNISKPAGALNALIIALPDHARTEVILPAFEGVYLFELEITNEPGIKAYDTMQVTLLPDPIKGTTKIYEELPWWQDEYLYIKDSAIYGYRNYHNTEVNVWDEANNTWFSSDKFPWSAEDGALTVYFGVNINPALLSKYAKVRVKFN